MFVGVSNIGKSTLLGKLRGDVYVARGWNERRDSPRRTTSTLSSDCNLYLIFATFKVAQITE